MTPYGQKSERLLKVDVGINNIPGKEAAHRQGNNTTFELTEDQLKYIMDKIEQVKDVMRDEIKNEDYEIDYIIRMMKKNFQENKIVSLE